MKRGGAGKLSRGHPSSSSRSAAGSRGPARWFAFDDCTLRKIVEPQRTRRTQRKKRNSLSRFSRFHFFASFASFAVQFLSWNKNAFENCHSLSGSGCSSGGHGEGLFWCFAAGGA